MKSSLFRRHFLLIAGVILISFALLAAAFMTLSYRFMVQEKKQDMAENAALVATLTQNVLNMGYDPTTDAMPLYGPAMSVITDSNVMFCDETGLILHYSDDEDAGDDYTGYTISPAVSGAVHRGGSYSGMTDLGLYSTLHFVSGVPIYAQTGDGQQLEYIIFLTASAEELLELWKAIATLFFFTAVVVLCIAFVSSSIFSLQQVKPLRDMSDAVRRYGMGDYSVRLEGYEKRTDEIGDLAVAFNAMADSLAHSEQQRQEFVANVSHELKTPMTTISGFTNGILDGTIPPEKVNDTLQVIAAETARLSRLVRRMLDASALKTQKEDVVLSQVEFDLCETTIQAMISLEGKIRANKLDMDIHIPDKPMLVWGDPDSITQVCYNLLDNAAKFAYPGTAITLTISSKGGKAYVSVKNVGETIPPEELGMIFDRFHKSDRSRSIDKEGVGLGLYIVQTILSNHNETITVTSQDGVTEFIFTLALAG